MKRPSRAIAAFAATAALFSVVLLREASAESSFGVGGLVKQGASFRTGIFPWSGGILGSSTSLDLDMSGSKEDTAFSASGSLSLLSGAESRALWGSMALDPGSAFAIISNPVFDPGDSPPAPAPDAMFVLKLRQVSVSWNPGSLSLESGYTTANWGQGKAFSPADFFAEIDIASGQPERRSKLLFRASWFPGPLSRIDLVASPQIHGPALAAARGYGLAGDTLALGISAGYQAPYSGEPSFALSGFEASLDLPWFSPYLEAAFRLPMDGSLDLGELQATFMAGSTAKIGSLHLLGEWLWKISPAPDFSVFALATYPFDEWISLAAPLSFDPDTGALSAGLALSAAELWGLDFSIGAQGAKDGTGRWTLGFSLQMQTRF